MKPNPSCPSLKTTYGFSGDSLCLHLHTSSRTELPGSQRSRLALAGSVITVPSREWNSTQVLPLATLNWGRVDSCACVTTVPGGLVWFCSFPFSWRVSR